MIVALNGTAAGGGAMLTLAADLVIASETARFVDVFGKQALIPDGGFLYLLPRIVGMHKAKEIVFFGETISAEGGARPRHREQGRRRRSSSSAATDGVGRRSSRRSRPRCSAGRRSCCTTRPRSRAPQVLETEATFIELNLGTEDGKERMAAMMEKRDPEWKGW